MIAAGWAAAASTVALAAGDAWNRHVRGWLPDDPPRPGRKQHARPMPLAGVLLLPAVAPWLCAAGAWWTLGAAAIATAVGFADDRGKERGPGLDWRWKAAGLALAAAAGATAVLPPTSEPLAWLGVAVFVFVLTNATNFLDNTDGVAAGLAATSLFAQSGGHGWVGAAAFAALAFVPWNWPRPRLFLGDGGAYCLGVLCAVAVAPEARTDWTALAAVAVPLVDFTQVVLARLWLGLPPWVGDRRHLTHIVQHLGVPRVLTAPLFCGAAWAVAALA